DDLRVEIAIVLVVPSNPLGRMAALRVEALRVDAVDAGDLERAAVDQVGDGADEAEVLVLEEAARRGRKPDHRTSALAEPEKLHAAAEGRRVPGDVFAVHRVLRKSPQEEGRDDRTRRRAEGDAIPGGPPAAFLIW